MTTPMVLKFLKHKLLYVIFYDYSNFEKNLRT
jgi:hypothetical protein